MELSKEKGIHLLTRDIPYREGILEVLEKLHNVQYIIIHENIYGQIKIEKLITQIKTKMPQINILIILTKKDPFKEKYLTEHHVKYIDSENLTASKILDALFSKNKIIAIAGSPGSGKTMTTLILSQILSKNKKILMVEDNIKNNSILKLYRKSKEELIIKINDNLYLYNLQKIMGFHHKDFPKIIEEINKIKNEFQYIFIDTQNGLSLKKYQEIISEIIFILNPNLLEINKIHNMVDSKTRIKIILNYDNENAMSEKIIENLFHHKAEVLGKIPYNKNYNLIIHHQLNMQYLDEKTRQKFLNIIKKI